MRGSLTRRTADDLRACDGDGKVTADGSRSAQGAATGGRGPAASVDEAMASLRELPFLSTLSTGFAAMGFAHADTHRHLRTGFPEVVLGQGKTPEQIAAILIELRRGGSTVMATRVTADGGRRGGRRGRPRRATCRCRARWSSGRCRRPTVAAGVIAVLSAGTADVPVAEEAALTAELAGNQVERIFDVGVARAASAAGLSRRRSRPAEILIVVRRHGGRVAQRGRRPVRTAGDRGADQRRLRRQPGRHGGVAVDAELVRAPAWRSSTSTTASAPARWRRC